MTQYQTNSLEKVVTYPWGVFFAMKDEYSKHESGHFADLLVMSRIGDALKNMQFHAILTNSAKTEVGGARSGIAVAPKVSNQDLQPMKEDTRQQRRQRGATSKL